MVRMSVVIAAVIAVSAGCRAEMATQGSVREPDQRAAAEPESPPAIRVPENPVDRSIRRDLNLAITQDPELKQREISFHVVNGDVSVMGTVGSEDERKKINELAMSIAGVKSVANAVRTAEQEAP